MFSDAFILRCIAEGWYQNRAGEQLRRSFRPDPLLCNTHIRSFACPLMDKGVDGVTVSLLAVLLMRTV